MGDSFIDSMNTGFQMAHVIESDRRQAEAAKVSAQLHQMQMMNYAAALMKNRQEMGLIQQKDIAREQMGREFQDVPAPTSFKPAQPVANDQYGFASGDIQELKPAGMQKSPLAQSFLSQYAPESQPAALKALQYGIQTGDHTMLDKIQKLPAGDGAVSTARPFGK